MEQYHTKIRDTVNQDGKNRKEPLIVVHCKAGKGRTGMMICALLVFMGMFPCYEQAIKHYNFTRAESGLALTIKSQIRYVKFFVGFLYQKLIDEIKDLQDINFFE